MVFNSWYVQFSREIQIFSYIHYDNMRRSSTLWCINSVKLRDSDNFNRGWKQLKYVYCVNSMPAPYEDIPSSSSIHLSTYSIMCDVTRRGSFPVSWFIITLSGRDAGKIGVRDSSGAWVQQGPPLPTSGACFGIEITMLWPFVRCLTTRPLHLHFTTQAILNY